MRTQHANAGAKVRLSRETNKKKTSKVNIQLNKNTKGQNANTSKQENEGEKGDFRPSSVCIQAQKWRDPHRISPEEVSPLKKAATYSPALRCSTIGAPGLNFSVRDGKRWNTGAKAT